jgi:hypothetical protein
VQVNFVNNKEVSGQAFIAFKQTHYKMAVTDLEIIGQKTEETEKEA